MNLIEQSLEGHKQRCNLLRLLCSEDTANWRVALEMMETGGVPVMVLFRLRKIRYAYDSIIHQSENRYLNQQFESLLDRGLAQLSPDLQEHLKFWRDPNGENWSEKRLRMAWEQADTFERIVAEGLVTWEEWFDYWCIGIEFFEEMNLTGSLLARGFDLPIESFLSGSNNGHHIRKPWLPILFDRNPSPEFQKQCLALLAHYDTLDLSGTRLSAIPEIAGELENVSIVNIGGTSIRSLPESLLPKITEVIGRKAQVRSIVAQAIQSTIPVCPLREVEQLRLGMLALSKNETSKAFQYFHLGAEALQRGIFPYKQRLELIRSYLGTAVETGNWQAAVQIISRMHSGDRSENPTLLFKDWSYWRGLTLAAGEEKQFYEVIAKEPERKNPPEHFFAVHWLSSWAYYFEIMLYKRKIEQAFQLLDRAKSEKQALTLSMFRWGRMLGHLKQKRDFETLQKLHDYLEGNGAWLETEDLCDWISRLLKRQYD